MSRKALRILVALDGTAGSETILAAIMPLVRITEVDLLLLKVAGSSGELEESRAYLGRMAGALALHRVRAESLVEVGEPGPAILSHLEAGRFDFCAMTTHGRQGIDRLLMGSVAESVVRSSKTPLIVNRPDARIGDWRRIVVPLDGSPAAEKIIEDVTLLVRMTGSTLHLINAAEVLVAAPGLEYAFSAVSIPDMKPYLGRVRDRLTAKGLNVVTEARIGFPGAEIVRYAADVGAGLIAMTTHGRTGLRRVIMGSVAEKIFRTAPCAVLVRPLQLMGKAGEVERDSRMPANR